MKKISIIVFLLAICFTPTLLKASNVDYSQAEWVAGHLMVNFDPSVGTLQTVDGKGNVISMGIPTVDALFAKYHVTKMKRIICDGTLNRMKIIPDFYRLMLLICPETTDVLAMMDEFEKCAVVNTAEPDIQRRFDSRTPDDPNWTNQWDKTQMSCPQAWDFTTGSMQITVVAIDGGTYWVHPDFFANLRVNPGEDMNHNNLPYTDTSYPGDQEDINGIDDDQNGFPDDLIGWDFIDNIGGCAAGEDCDGEDNDPYGMDSHGTHVIGLEAAVGNNGIGLSGVNWNVSLQAIRAGYLSNNGTGYVPQSASFPAIAYAVANIPDHLVINMSYGGASFGSTENNVMQAAWSNGAILVGAAGNDHVTPIHYPAGYANVVSVGSLDQNLGMSDFSNYGTWVDVYAPGGNVMSTVIPGYGLMMGTSMASPNCAGVFALLWSLFPGKNNSEMIDLVFNNCVDITAQNPDYDPTMLGNGRVDATKPIASLFPLLTLTDSQVSGDNDSDNRIEPGETGNVMITLHNEINWSPGQDITVSITTADPNLIISNGIFTLPTINPGTSVSNISSPFSITVANTVTEAYYASLCATITGAYGYSYQIWFNLRIGRPQTLVVADDGVDLFHDYFVNALSFAADSMFNNDVWHVNTHGDPTLNDIHEYGIVIWVCGNDSTTTLTAENQSVLSQYLDNGGKLLLAGQGIDEDPQVNSSAFYSNYLHVQSSPTGGSRTLTGVASDPISNGTTLLLLGGSCGGNGQVGPSQIVPIENAVGFYTYNTIGGVGATRYEGAFKTVYFAFAIEAACGLNGSTNHKVILRRTMDWLGGHPVFSDVENPITPTVPRNFALKGNYPNPFNPTTTIAFDLATSANVTLRVYDLLGRLVTTLVEGDMSAGAHSIMFDGSNQASGVYLVQLQANGYTDTKRMVLLK